MRTIKKTTRKVAKKPMRKAQKGKEVSANSTSAKKIMSNIKYPASVKTQSDSTAYKAGFASGKMIAGYGKAGVTSNPNYKLGEAAAKKKYGGSVTKKKTTSRVKRK